MMPDAFAGDMMSKSQTPQVENLQPVMVQSAKVLSLLLILEALRLSPITDHRQKV